MRKIIPDFIINKYEKNQISGSTEAHVLNVDLIGFTSLTHKIMENSHFGVEVLIDTINKLFIPIVEAIENWGGFISGFAGDAFTAIFTNSTNENILSVAFEIRNIFIQMEKQVTEFGDFSLLARIGIAMGKVGWQIIQIDNQLIYWFSGKGINSAVKAQEISQINEVIASIGICDSIDSEVIHYTNIDDNYCHVQSFWVPQSLLLKHIRFLIQHNSFQIQ